MSFKVNITEVGLRDGLQNVDLVVKTEDKLFIVNGLIDACLLYTSDAADE